MLMAINRDVKSIVSLLEKKNTSFSNFHLCFPVLYCTHNRESPGKKNIYVLSVSNDFAQIKSKRNNKKKQKY